MNKPRCFVIQPFGTKTNGNNIVDNDKVYEALKKLETIQPNFPIEVARGDTENVDRENLHSHVTDCIKRAHFCITDLTGQNPNVLYETGYARGLNQKVIIIAQNKEDIPTDLEGSMIVLYKMAELESLANNIQHHFGRIKESVHKKTQDEQLERIPYLPRRNEDLIKEKIRGSKNRIDILQTNLSTLNFGFIDEIINTLSSHTELELRILTLDPQSFFVNFRAEQLGISVGVFRNELHSALASIEDKLKEFKERVKIKIYDDFPSQISFFFDQEIMSCVVSAMGRSRENCAFLVNQSMSGTQKSFKDHFEHLWNHSDFYRPAD